jgi:tripartite-type tricarboxylate transporter receptor subunit TctC
MGVSFPRRRFLQLAAAAALPIAPQAARAEAFPTRPLRLMVGFPPGGIGDIITRMLALPLQDRLGQPVVVENRSGAGGNVATEYVVRSAPDGYTLMCSGPFNTINATLYDNLSFDYIRDIAMVASVMRGPLVMAIDPSLRVTSVADFITYAKANPDKVNMASSGNGTAPHLAGELFSMMTGVKMVHVPYRGDGPSLADVVSGQLQVVFANLPPAIGHIRAGRLRALAVTTTTRSPALPYTPPLSDTVPGYDVDIWYGLGAPKATPPQMIATLNAAINACVADPAFAARLADFGTEPMRLSPQAFDAFVSADAAKWASVVKFSGARVD